MDLLSIMRAIWRHKLATIPVILLTMFGAFYILEIKPATYETSSSFLLVNPPAAPTASQLATDPSLRRINPNNPYVNYNNLQIVADVVISLVTAAPAQQALVQAGADPRYQVALSTAWGSPPILQVTGVASSPEEAIRTANLVTRAAITDLYKAQKRQGVNDFYMIKAVEIVQPHGAQAVVSAKLRSLIAVLALGLILLFVAVSAAEAMGKRRTGALTRDDASAKVWPDEEDLEPSRRAHGSYRPGKRQPRSSPASERGYRPFSASGRRR